MTIFIFIIIPFKYALLTKREVVNMTGYMAKFLFLHFVRLSKSPLFFSWLVMPRDLFARSVRDLMHWSSLRSLLRTYERKTCSKSSIVFTDTKSGPMNKRTTPIYATCTSSIMHLICPPKFCISIIFNLSWDGCNIQKKWKTAWTVLQNLGGGKKGALWEMCKWRIQLSWPNKLGQESIYFTAKLSWFWFTTVCLAVI